MATTETVKQQVAARQGEPGQTPAKRGSHGHTLLDTLETMRPQIARALPSMVSPERFIRVALTTLRQNPRLLQCTPESVLGGLMTSAQLGLEPGPLGHAYLVPFKVKGQYQAQWILGYTGIIDLARRSGQVESIQAHEVYEHDEFDYSYGLDEHLEHRPAEGDRGTFRGAYAYAKYTGGGHNFVYLPKVEVERHRARSRAKDNGPWVTDYDAMARKTAIRALRPYLPLSVEMADAFSADESTRLFSGDAGDVIDVAPDPEPELEASTAETSADDGGQADPPEAEQPAEEEAGSASGRSGPAPHPADGGRPGPLSKTEYARLRELGFDDDTRSQLVYVATDGRTRTSKELEAQERRRVMRIARLHASGVVQIVDGPDDEPTLVDGDGAVLPAAATDDLADDTDVAQGVETS